MTISISTANFKPKNKKAEVDGVVIIAMPQTSASSLAALDIADEAKKINENDTAKAREIIRRSHEHVMSRFVNREDAERVFAGLDDQVIVQIYKEIIEKGEDAE